MRGWMVEDFSSANRFSSSAARKRAEEINGPLSYKQKIRKEKKSFKFKRISGIFFFFLLLVSFFAFFFFTSSCCLFSFLPFCMLPSYFLFLPSSFSSCCFLILCFPTAASALSFADSFSPR